MSDVPEDVLESDGEADDEGEETSLAAQTKAALHAIMVAPMLVLSPILSAFPPAWKLYHKLSKWSIYQMQKAANADSLANVRRSNGHEDILPARWVDAEDDEKDLTGWKIKGLGSKRYDQAIHGRNTTRIGKANMIHVNEDDTEQGTWTEAAINNAIHLGREKYLFRDAKVELVLSGSPDQGGETALADGGQTSGLGLQNVSVERPGILHDTVAPIGSREGYDGQVVSIDQFSDLKNEQSDQETVAHAKNSAWAAAKLDEIEGADVFKWFLILGAVGLILLFHSEIGAFITGLTGGSGGGGGAVGGALGTLAVLAKPGVR